LFDSAAKWRILLPSFQLNINRKTQLKSLKKEKKQSQLTCFLKATTFPSGTFASTMRKFTNSRKALNTIQRTNTKIQEK